MNSNVNISMAGHDTRSIQRIIFEKANFGAPPVEFSLAGIEGWHPVQWTQHPRLAAVKFADGSVVYIDSPPAYAPMDPIAKGGDNFPWPETAADSADKIWDRNIQADANLLQDLESELADRAVVDVVLTGGLAAEQIRGAFSGVAREPVAGEVDLPEESEVVNVIAEYDAELRNVHRDGSNRLHGFIYNDKRPNGARFEDGAWVTTSKIEADFGDDRFRTETGTIYYVVSWVKDQNLGARLAVAQNIQKEAPKGESPEIAEARKAVEAEKRAFQERAAAIMAADSELKKG